MAAPAGMSWSHDLGYVVHTMDLRDGGSRHNGLRLACGAFCVDSQSFVDVFTVDVHAPEVVKKSARLQHYYPPSRVRWLTSSICHESPELLVTSGDCVRVWSASGELRSLMKHEENPKGVCTPLTSVDVSIDTSLLASCDIYGICSFWDADRGALGPGALAPTQAIDLGQPLSDVAFGPGHSVVATGESGDVFLIDRRDPRNVQVLAAPGKVSGPARLAWSPEQRPNLFAAAWQGPGGGIALYPGREEAAGRSGQGAPKMLTSAGSPAVAADVRWSPAFPELLCCAKEDGVVDVWQLPEDRLSAAVASEGPNFQWEPCQGAVCTAMALSGQVPKAGCASFMALATMPGPNSPQVGQGGTLWIAGLPEPTGYRYGTSPLATN